MQRHLVAIIGIFSLLCCGIVRAQDAIKIGHYGSLTGSEATFGQSTSNGIKLAISEFNQAGGLNGRKIELVEYDTKGDAREAGAVVTRLVKRDHVVTVLGEVASSLSLAGAPICQEGKVPMITPSSTNPRVTKVGDYIFRVCFVDDFQGFVMAKFSTATLKAKRVAILQDQASAYSVYLADSFEKYLKEMGGEVPTRQSYNAGETDFNPRLTAIRATNPDAIYIPGYYTDVANIAIQARKLGIKVPLLGGDGWDSSKLTEIGKEAVEGCYFSNHAAPDEPAMVTFAQKYRDEYGSDPDALAALAYDAANILFDAMKHSKSLDGPDLREALAAAKFDGVTGKIAFDQNRDTTKGAVVVKVSGGKLAMAERIDPKK